MLHSDMLKLAAKSAKDTGSLNAFGKSVSGEIAQESGISLRQACEMGLDWFLALNYPNLVRALKGKNPEKINVTIEVKGGDFAFKVAKA